MSDRSGDNTSASGRLVPPLGIGGENEATLQRIGEQMLLGLPVSVKSYHLVTQSSWMVTTVVV